MTLKRDDPESRAFWKSVEDARIAWDAQQPDWSRRMDLQQLLQRADETANWCDESAHTALSASDGDAELNAVWIGSTKFLELAQLIRDLKSELEKRSRLSIVK